MNRNHFSFFRLWFSSAFFPISSWWREKNTRWMLVKKRRTTDNQLDNVQQLARFFLQWKRTGEKWKFIEKPSLSLFCYELHEYWLKKMAQYHCFGASIQQKKRYFLIYYVWSPRLLKGSDLHSNLEFASKCLKWNFIRQWWSIANFPTDLHYYTRVG